MKFRLRHSLFFACGLVFGAAVAIGGCNNNRVATPGIDTSDWLHRVAHSIRVGRAFDRAVIASRNRDEAALERANDELIALEDDSTGKSPTLRQAESLVWQAQRLDSAAMRKPDTAATQSAAKLYRQALRLSPQFDSSDADLLNALGYFLADRGTSRDDFKLAENLTQRSLQLMKGREFDELNRAIVRDSLAWALFRQNRLTEAAREQEAAIAQFQKAIDASKIGGLTGAMPADLPFHLGEIYRAQKRLEDARAQYQRALKLEADHRPSRDALNALPVSI